MKPLSPDKLEPLTDQEQAFLSMVRQHLQTGRKDRVNGEMAFTAHFKDGGIADKWSAIRIREK